jgi:hypothetical protein
MMTPRAAFMIATVAMFSIGIVFYALRWLWIAMIAVAMLLHAYSMARADDTLIEPAPQEYADIQTWIPQTCCWTNNCCKKVHISAITPLSRDEYRINASGQTVKRKGWSQDGQTWRCTCDNIDGRWVVHLKADTRCLFPVPNGY